MNCHGGGESDSLFSGRLDSHLGQPPPERGYWTTWTSKLMSGQAIAHCLAAQRFRLGAVIPRAHITILAVSQQCKKHVGSGTKSLSDVENAKSNRTYSSMTSCLLMTELFRNPEMISLSQLTATNTETNQRKSLVFLIDLDKSLLAEMPESLFRPFQSLVHLTTNILWEEFYSPQETARYITQVYTSGFSDAGPEIEYTVRNGLIHTGRLTSEAPLEARFRATVNSNSKTAAQRLLKVDHWLPGPGLKVEIEAPDPLRRSDWYKMTTLALTSVQQKSRLKLKYGVLTSETSLLLWAGSRRMILALIAPAWLLELGRSVI
ncbi:hypothetical protein F5Y01DRAFT_80364 [Xylaria sp. FL0043]|nr:hypothetical protein F5Y01DRAFT_80364 [Xylaria sp. FL0043]